MSTYFIGDVHGCYDELMILLDRINFDKQQDQLIFVGDLINRGPKSLEVLRFVKGLGKNAQVVLGNHDISLFAYAAGIYHGNGTDFPKIMQVPDGRELCDWLRHQPLLIHLEKENIFVVHAGIPPRWTLQKAKKQAKKAEKKLQSDNFAQYLQYAYDKNKRDKWHNDFNKYDKFRYRLNVFTRMRYCDEYGEPDYNEKCPLGEQRAGFMPWFFKRTHLQKDNNAKIIFGHWAALGYYEGVNAWCIDSGCAWGYRLTAVSITDNGITKVQAPALSKRY